MSFGFISDRARYDQKYATTINEPRSEKTGLGFSTRFDTNRAVQPQKIARDLKFRILEVEGSYYQCSENKGADQLRGYR